MMRVGVKTLIVLGPPAPSALILVPQEELDENPTSVGIHAVLPIWVGTPEAISLGVALEQGKTERPLTHDLFLNALTSLDSRIEKVVIDRLQGKTFSAHLYLTQYERTIELDSRPSDAIALALRQDAPIYVEDSIFEQGSFPYIVRDSATEEETLREFHSFLENVAPDDFLPGNSVPE